MSPSAIEHPRHFSIVEVVLVVLATLAESVSVGMVAILLPVTLEDMGYRSAVIGGVLALQGLAAIAVGLLLAKMIRRAGALIGLLASTVIRVGALVALARSGELAVWIVVVGMYGAGAFAFVQLLQTWIASMPSKRRGLLIGLFGTAVSVGMALGPVVLRLLPLAQTLVDTILAAAAFETFGDREPFLLSAAISAVALVPLLPLYRRMPSFAGAAAMSAVALVRRTPATLCAVAVAGVTMYAVIDFVTLYGLRNGLSVADAALMLTSFLLGSLVLEAPIASASDALDRRYVIVGLVLLGMICAVYLPVAIYVPTHAWALLFVWGGVTGGLYSVTLALIGDGSAQSERMAIGATYSLMENIGGTVGTLTIGVSMDLLGSDGLPYVILLAGCVYFTYALYRYPVV